MNYVKLTIKGNKRNRSHWAIVDQRLNGFTIYMPCDSEGLDKGYYRKDGTLIMVKELIQNTLIVKEQPAIISKKYGTLELV